MICALWRQKHECNITHSIDRPYLTTKASPLAVTEHSPLVSTTTGFLVLFIGKRLNRELKALRDYSSPEPVSGGLLIAALLTLIHVLGGLEFNFNLDSSMMASLYCLVILQPPCYVVFQSPFGRHLSGLSLNRLLYDCTGIAMAFKGLWAKSFTAQSISAI